MQKLEFIDYLKTLILLGDFTLKSLAIWPWYSKFIKSSACRSFWFYSLAQNFGSKSFNGLQSKTQYIPTVQYFTTVVTIDIVDCSPFYHIPPANWLRHKMDVFSLPLHLPYHLRDVSLDSSQVVLVVVTWLSLRYDRGILHLPNMSITIVILADDHMIHWIMWSIVILITWSITLITWSIVTIEELQSSDKSINLVCF